MVYIPKFADEFVGKKYKDGNDVEYTAIGYGDNDSNGNPFIVGSKIEDTGRTIIRTHLFKHVEFLP
jgi:hypothetical protein